jgi:hypothetical protein
LSAPSADEELEARKVGIACPRCVRFSTFSSSDSATLA